MNTPFHALHHGDTPLLLPNAWDHASATLLVEAGFRAIGTTSFGVAAAHGLPDGHGRTREHVVRLAELLAPLPCLLTVDIESGFSADPAEVAELAADLFALGVVGINLEDSREHDRLADPAEQTELIAAVKRRVPGLFVNARVDTYWIGVDADLGPTLARAGQYRAAGADGIFVPGELGAGDIAALVRSLDVPLNVLHRPHLYSVTELARWGVNRISTGSHLFRTALATARDTALDLARSLAPRDGTSDNSSLVAQDGTSGNLGSTM
ncbi:isocitrate lyase/PEP mutase family protein [Saccharomonospora saliphila]|uniref:isocitrate lyase/PEP mutase family protein n=1 Tax=Saccharomonospora saliphila TaxID=369829 RepID=UPI000374CF11|nr:isocitrate lyase/phosphoenolpyruvate mutase family protein [Saccharomonospora saliphila]